ncbi:MAG: hypoxanthine phosphoribosyltransferase [Bacteroidia bacterium]|nr:hypoxanthine phosphoribosyltransferase [Bacteroidia bacterium]
MKDKPIYIHNSRFKPAISEERILGVIKDMADEINRDLGDKKPLFLSVLNGAFLFTADLIKHFNNECEISFVKMASYSGTESGQLKSLIGLTEDVAGRNIVILEDIIDSGATVDALLEELKEKNPASVSVAALIFKPEAFKRNFAIDYVGIKIPNDFIVGYGMDYDGLGRNLRDIYVIDPE